MADLTFSLSLDWQITDQDDILLTARVEGTDIEVGSVLLNEQFFHEDLILDLNAVETGHENDEFLDEWRVLSRKLHYISSRIDSLLATTNKSALGRLVA